MKSLFASLFMLLAAYAGFAQYNFDQKISSRNSGNPHVSQNAKKQHNPKNTNIVDVVPIGTSGNAWEFMMGHTNSRLWVNNDLNTIVFGHRMGGSLDPAGNTSDLGYDISRDGGLTWESQIEIYTADTIGGGYPQYFPFCSNFGIYNPQDNLTPENAMLTSFSTMHGDEEVGYLTTLASIGDQSDTSHQIISPSLTSGNIYRPYGYTISHDGEIWAADLKLESFPPWEPSILVSHGVWDEELQDFSFDFFELTVPTIDNVAPTDVNIEFSPDGEKGIIMVLADILDEPLTDGLGLSPVYWRTTNGGETWEGPESITLAGPNGIDEIQEVITDEEIIEIFGEFIPRDEIPFTCDYHFDLSVDKWGNPQIAVLVSVAGADPYSIITTKSQSTAYLFVAPYLINTTDPSDPSTKFAYKLGKLQSYRGDYYDDFIQDNRIQIARDKLGEFMFVAWLDTDTLVSPENNSPDIWARGIRVAEHMMTWDEQCQFIPNNVTFGSAATFSAHCFSMANEVFTSEGGSNWDWVLPFTYSYLNPGQASDPIQHKYILDFSYHYSDFLVGVPEYESVTTSRYLSISALSPNPARDYIEFELFTENKSNVALTVMDASGKKTQDYQVAEYKSGSTKKKLNIETLKPGIYILRADCPKGVATAKFIVQ